MIYYFKSDAVDYEIQSNDQQSKIDFEKYRKLNDQKEMHLLKDYNNMRIDSYDIENKKSKIDDSEDYFTDSEMKSTQNMPDYKSINQNKMNIKEPKPCSGFKKCSLARQEVELQDKDQKQATSI